MDCIRKAGMAQPVDIHSLLAAAAANLSGTVVATDCHLRNLGCTLEQNEEAECRHSCRSRDHHPGKLVGMRDSFSSFTPNFLK
jgi:hypothetical protein